MSSAPGYMVILVRESTGGAIPFLWFRSRCRNGEDGFRLDGVGRGLRKGLWLLGEDLL